MIDGSNSNQMAQRQRPLSSGAIKTSTDLGAAPSEPTAQTDSVLRLAVFQQRSSGYSEGKTVS